MTRAAPTSPWRLALPLLAVAGCGSEPSWVMRWEVEPRLDEVHQPLPEQPNGPGVQNPNECTRVGILNVEVAARDEFDRLVDVRSYSCFPREFHRPDGMARGAVLSPGFYNLVIRGVGRDGVGWTGAGAVLDRNGDGVDEFDPIPTCVTDGECEAGFLACDCRDIEVVDGETVRLDDLVLDPPPQCDDGIDNDLDGLVDSIDPGCALGLSEYDDITTVQFRLRVGLLGNNPNVTCTGAGVTAFQLAVVNRDTGEERLSVTTQCPADPYFFEANFDDGNYDLTVTALGPGAEPKTVAKGTSFEVRGSNSLVELAIDFGDADFLSPIVARGTIPLRFQSIRGGDTFDCNNDNLAHATRVESLRVEVLDARGNPLAAPLRDSNGTPLDGTERPCPTSNLQTEVLRWGGYQVHIEGLSGAGEICFETTTSLAPGDAQFTIRRVGLADDQQVPDAVPASCSECTLGDPQRQCRAGVCSDIDGNPLQEPGAIGYCLQ